MSSSIIRIPNPNLQGGSLCGEFDLRDDSKQVVVLCHGLLDNRNAALIKYLAQNLSCNCFRCACGCIEALHMHG
jgi:hypothetical protein